MPYLIFSEIHMNQLFSQFFWLFAADANMPLYEELWYHFYDNYINNQTIYQNLNMSGILSAQGIVIGLFLGLAIATVAASVTKKLNSVMIKKLISEECLSVDKAKSLPQLDLADKLYLRYAVRKSVNLRRVVKCAEEEEHDRRSADIAENYEEKRKENPSLPKKFKPIEFKVDPDEHHFYIPEELKYTAETKFDEKGNSLLSTLFWLGVLLIVFVIIMIFLPNILSVIDSFVGSLKQ